MKFIISEEQSSLPEVNRRLKKFIISKYNEGWNIPDMKKYFGLSNKILIDLLLDQPIKFAGMEKCELFYDLLYKFLLEELKHVHQYPDLTRISTYWDSLSGSMQFSYGNKSDNVNGYATMFWDGGCYLPINTQDRYAEKMEDYVDFEHDITVNLDDNDLKKIKTIGDLINFYNTEYFRIIKQEMDSIL